MKGWVIPPINSFVARYDDGIDHPKLNPDTCGHLILTPKSQAYDYQSEANLKSLF